MFRNRCVKIDKGASFNEYAACRNLPCLSLKAKPIMQTQTIEFVRPIQPQATPQRWSVDAVEALFKLPFADLLYRAQQVHREHFDPNAVQLSTLLSIKTGGCSEDCGYCPQSAFHSAGVENKKMLDVSEVVKAAKAAQDAGAGRFCMGAAWREPSKEDMVAVVEMVKEVRALGMETCATLGMLNDEQTEQLRSAGLDYYNHNLDTTPEFYGNIISTRDYQDRLDTLERVRKAGMHVCSGGIVGMGENLTQRAGSGRATGQYGTVPGERADQQSGQGGRHAAGADRGPRSAGLRAHHRRGAHHHADRARAALCRTPADVRRSAGFVFPRRCELHLLRRPVADHGQPRCRARPRAAGQAGHVPLR